MELSPLAKERLAKISDLSPEEKKKLRVSEDVVSLISNFFTGKLDADGLWLELKRFKEDGKDFMIKEAQYRILKAITLGSNAVDFERSRSAILGCETLKEQNKYSGIELNLSSIDNLRHQYQQEQETHFNSMKDNIRGQVEMTLRQMAGQAGHQHNSIDIESSVEASVKADPQWRKFIMNHEKNYGQKFDELSEMIQNLI